MLAIVKTIDGVKKLVPLDKTLAPAMDIVPNNTIMMFSNTTNSLVDTGIRVNRKCDGKVNALNFSGLCNKIIDISAGGNNAWGTYNWECPNRDRMVIGSNNQMNGYGYKQVYGFANVACPMGDSTTILLGSANHQCYGSPTGLAMVMGVFNYLYYKQGTSLTYGLSNCIYGLCDPNFPAECAACEGVSENSIYGINNKVCTAWSHVHGSGNIAGGWSSINVEDQTTHAITNHKIVGTIDIFGNNNCAHGAGTLIFGHNNTTCYSLNTAIYGVTNFAWGCAEAGYKYNQFIFGISNTSCGYDTVAIGTSNIVKAPMSTAIGRWNTICAGAAGGIAIGNGAMAIYHRGFTRSSIKAGNANGSIPGSTTANSYTSQLWMISGCGTLEDFYYAMSCFGTVAHSFTGDFKIALGATCATFDKMNKYSGVSWSDQSSGDIWFTGDANFSFQNNVEWFLAGTNTHENYLMKNVYQYLHCPVEAHITLTSA